MTRKDTFEQDKRSYSGKIPGFSELTGDPELGETDTLYCAADALSMINAEKHRRVLLALSVAGSLLTLLFLLYDEAELYGLIFACGVMVLSLYLIRYIAERSEYHRKYLEYRVLAESLRIQYYVFFSGICERVSGLMPWSIRQDLPWVVEILDSLPVPQSNISRPIADFWIKDQKEYHKSKLAASVKKNLLDNRIAAATVIVTVVAYVAAMVFEIFVRGKLIGKIDVDLIRTVLKIFVGTMSAITLFTGNYFGKMSLPNIIDDHKRMIALYETVEEQIRTQGENKELVLFLARECLNENSTWYAYQNKNKPDLVI